MICSWFYWSYEWYPRKAKKVLSKNINLQFFLSNTTQFLELNISVTFKENDIFPWKSNLFSFFSPVSFYCFNNFCQDNFYTYLVIKNLVQATVHSVPSTTKLSVAEDITTCAWPSTFPSRMTYCSFFLQALDGFCSPWFASIVKVAIL